jgi:PadR family transcriptional regulator, regulatory protein PadR
MTGRKAADFGSLEAQVMLAILRQTPNAYGVSISDEIEHRTGREHSLGSIYAAIDRLGRNGFLERRQGRPTAERGGRAKIYFTLTALGEVALDRYLNAVAAMSADLRQKDAFT